MTYIELIGLPGSGKTTYVKKYYKDHKNAFSFTKTIDIENVTKIFKLFFHLYGLKYPKRLVYSIYHTVQVVFTKNDLILDQGIFQIYLSHCSDQRCDIDYQVFDAFQLFLKKAGHYEFIFTKKLCFEEINSRLISRNLNRKEGISEDFYAHFIKNQKLLSEFQQQQS